MRDACRFTAKPKALLAPSAVVMRTRTMLSRLGLCPMARLYLGERSLVYSRLLGMRRSTPLCSAASWRSVEDDCRAAPGTKAPALPD